MTKAVVEAPLAAGLATAGIDLLYADERLRTAVELFCDAQRETFLRSRFQTLITALEVLTAPTPKHDVAQELLDRLDEQIAKALSVVPEDTDERHALESLRRELVFRRETSIRSRIRELVLNALSHLPSPEQKRRARDAVWAYDVRGTLVHDGTVPNTDLGKAFAITRATIRDVLTARMQRIADSTEP